MTWATVITLGVMGLMNLVPTRKSFGENFAGVLIGLWAIACAYAMWDRYLP